ncbi:MAG: hypothetical protein JHC28_06520 [Thermoprotei archaeon]|nr:hypothetical protein [Thermoprotei archaeon]
MSETQVSQVHGISAPDEALLFDYLRANLGAAHLLFENMESELAIEIMYRDRPTERAKAEAVSMLGEIFNAFEVVLFFVERAESYGLNDPKPEAYVDDLLRALRDLVKVYHDLKKGIALSDIIYSLRDIRARLEGAYDSILETLIQKVYVIKVASENKS